jgi:ribonuclease P protein component
MPRSIARSITSFTKNEIHSLFNRAHSFLKKEGLDIRLAPKNQDNAKILLVVSRKTGNSPQRNLLKRRIKAIFYEDQFFKREFDWIIVTRAQACALSFSQIKVLMLTAYERAHDQQTTT